MPSFSNFNDRRGSKIVTVRSVLTTTRELVPAFYVERFDDDYATHQQRMRERDRGKSFSVLCRLLSLFLALVVLPTVVVALFTVLTPPAQAQGRDILLPPVVGSTWHGVFLPITHTITSSQITTFEAQANKKIGSILYYVGWYVNAWANVQQQINVVDPMGIKIHVTWEPNLKNGGDPLAAILSGSQNAIIDDFANQSKNWGHPFYLRFAHEMNGNWYSWSGALTGNNPQKYIDAWRYVWNRFQAAGNTNAVWVWCPNGDSVPADPWNNLNNYYPGGSYVDWVGVDFYGLKWGDGDPATGMDKVYNNYSPKPIMVAETAAADCANYAPGVTMTKDGWINKFFADMVPRPNIQAFFWFNDNKAREADWRITSCPNPAAQDAYMAGVANARYVTRP
jgi:Glycosyl hydrolase family 26